MRFRSKSLSVYDCELPNKKGPPNGEPFLFGSGGRI